MRFAITLTSLLGAGFSVSWAYCHFRPSVLGGITAALFFLSLAAILLFNAISGFTRWRKTSRYWPVPALLCLAILSCAWTSQRFGIILADWQFRRHLGEYTAIVSQVKRGSISCTNTLEIADVSGLPAYVRSVRAARCGYGAFVVEFLTTSDVPLLHEGYVFKGYTEADGCVTRDMEPEQNWRYVRHVQDNWYHFSDSPAL